MWRLLFIAFLVAHGLVHLAIWLMPKPKDQQVPFDTGHSWLLGDQRPLSVASAVVAAAFLIAGGLGLSANADWWRGATVIGLAISFGLMILYFNLGSSSSRPSTPGCSLESRGSTGRLSRWSALDD